MEAVQADAHRVNAGGTVCGRSCGGGADNVHTGGAVVVLARIHQGNVRKGFHNPTEIVLLAVVVARTAGSRTHLEQHCAVHQQHGGFSVDGVNQLVELINESIAVAVQLGGGRQINIRGQRVGRAVQQLPQAVKGVHHIAGTGAGRCAVDDQVVEIVAGCLDFLLCLERQLIHSPGGVLKNTVDLEGAAHDDGFRGLLHALCLTGGILAVNGTNSSGRGGLELDVSIGQGRTASAGRNGVIKHHSVQ